MPSQISCCNKLFYFLLLEICAQTLARLKPATTLEQVISAKAALNKIEKRVVNKVSAQKRYHISCPLHQVLQSGLVLMLDYIILFEALLLWLVL